MEYYDEVSSPWRRSSERGQETEHGDGTYYIAECCNTVVQTGKDLHR